MNILSIDPGLAAKGGTGWALWTDNILVAAGLATTSAYGLEARIIAIEHEIDGAIGDHIAGDLDEVVIEQMQVYTLDKQKGDQNDLIDLSLLGGRLSCLAETLTLVRPGTWKGQVPKSVLEKRTRATLGPGELQAFERGVEGVAKGAHHNVWDAVGIGLWRLGRSRR